MDDCEEETGNQFGDKRGIKRNPSFLFSKCFAFLRDAVFFLNNKTGNSIEKRVELIQTPA